MADAHIVDYRDRISYMLFSFLLAWQSESFNIFRVRSPSVFSPSFSSCSSNFSVYKRIRRRWLHNQDGSVAVRSHFHFKCRHPPGGSFESDSVLENWILKYVLITF